MTAHNYRVNRAAFHEIGHLAALVTLDLGHTVKTVKLMSEGQGEVLLSETGAGPSRMTAKQLEQYILVYSAGEVLEQMAFGKNEREESAEDRKNVGRLLMRLMFRAPHRALVLWRHRYDMTRTLLESIPQETLQSVASQLRAEKQWDRQRVQAVCQKLLLQASITL